MPHPVAQEDPERRRAEDDSKEEEAELEGGQAKEEDVPADAKRVAGRSTPA
jgi:hypothetical protein